MNKPKRYVPGGRISIYLPQSVPPEIIKFLNAQTEIGPAILKVIGAHILQHGIEKVGIQSSPPSLTDYVQFNARSVSTPSRTLEPPEHMSNVPNHEQPHDPGEMKMNQDPADSSSSQEGESFWKGTLIDEDGLM